MSGQMHTSTVCKDFDRQCNLADQSASSLYSMQASVTGTPSATVSFLLKDDRGGKQYADRTQLFEITVQPIAILN